MKREVVKSIVWAFIIALHSRGRYRGRIPKSLSVRQRARTLHLRFSVCCFRAQLSLRHVASTATDSLVLAARLGSIL